MKVVALAGGVGGAKLVDGLAQLLPSEDLAIIVNTGDDFEYFGLKVCPDLDTVCYTLAGLDNPETGWGRKDETWNAIDNLSILGGPDWFRLGDCDLGTHLERTRRLKNGSLLSEVTNDFCKAWGIDHQIFPMSDMDIPTIVSSDEGELPFQEYFVHRKCVPKVSGFRFEGVEFAFPPEGVKQALTHAKFVVICPSNPFVSIDPILAVPGIRELISSRLDSRDLGPLKVVAISPIIGGKAVKGPLAKMLNELGYEPSSYSVAKYYQNLIHGFVFDQVDSKDQPRIQALGHQTFVTNTLMKTSLDRKILANEIMEFCEKLISKG